MKALFIISLFLFTITSCTKECLICKDSSGSEIEFCKEESLIYTDTNGNEVNFDEMIAELESLGWTCD